MTKPIRTLALTVSLLSGLGWAVVCLAIALFAGGWSASTPKETVVSIGGLLFLFAAPLCLVVGSLLAFQRKAPAIAAIACGLGSVCLSAVVADAVYGDFHRNSAELPAGFLYLAGLVFVAIVCDLSAIYLGVEWKQYRLGMS
jgi:hypothetical protein